MKVLRVMISGQVHGVGYRAWFAGTAEQLGVSGWVRNRRDGSVEALVSGTDEALAELCRMAGQGPAMARIDHVECREAEDRDLADGMEVRPTL